MELNEADFLDSVAEILNIGMGYAASVLSEMVKDEVKLSIPGVQFVSRHEALKLLQTKTDQDVSGIVQRFHGVMSGDVALLFPEEKSLELVRVVLQQDISLEDLTEMEQEAMTEIGNVILNGCLSSIADLFQQEIIGDMPEFIKGALATILLGNNLHQNQHVYVLLLNMEFSLDKKQIGGYVSFLMDVESMTIFKQNVTEYFGL